MSSLMLLFFQQWGRVQELRFKAADATQQYFSTAQERINNEENAVIEKEEKELEQQLQNLRSKRDEKIEKRLLEVEKKRELALVHMKAIGTTDFFCETCHKLFYTETIERQRNNMVNYCNHDKGCTSCATATSYNECYCCSKKSECAKGLIMCSSLMIGYMMSRIFNDDKLSG
jgi:hypothetical protein